MLKDNEYPSCHRLPNDYNIQNGALYRIAIMNEDIGKFGYDSMQQRTKKTKIMKKMSLRTFTAKFLTCNGFVF